MANDKGSLEDRTLLKERRVERLMSRIAVGFAAILLGGYTVYAVWNKTHPYVIEVQKERIQSRLELKEGYYNKNQLLDKYYEINGQKVPVEVDGKPIADYFKE